MPPAAQSLTSHRLAESVGVSESSVKRWVDDGIIPSDRTAGGYRRIPLAAAVGFIRHHPATPSDPRRLSADVTPRTSDAYHAAATALLETILRDRTAETRAIITGCHLGRASAASIADHLIRPALAELGEVWRHRPEGRMLEHRAVDTCILALNEMALWLPNLQESAPVAVRAGGEGGEGEWGAEEGGEGGGRSLLMTDPVGEPGGARGGNSRPEHRTVDAVRNRGHGHVAIRRATLRQPHHFPACDTHARPVARARTRRCGPRRNHHSGRARQSATAHPAARGLPDR